MAMLMTEPVQILIVEDEPLIAMMLEDFLDALGKDVAGTAETVSTALEEVAKGGVDAAILVALLVIPAQGINAAARGEAPGFGSI